MCWGMQLPPSRSATRCVPGMAVAQIPDLKNWEVTARIGELDRGHLSAGQKVQVSVVAFPGKSFTGHSARTSAARPAPSGTAISIAKIAIDEVFPDLRPGMSSQHRDHHAAC